MPLPTLDDFKAHLNITSSANDAELGDFLYAAVDVVEGVVGPLRGRSVTETHYRVSSPLLVLRHSPVMSVESLTFSYQPGAPSTAYLAGDYSLDAEAGVLRLAAGFWFRGDVTVTYTTGYDTVPPALQLATLVVGKYLWETQRPASSARTAGAAEPVNDYGYSPGLPERAKILMEPFTRGPGVA